jgi:hypothetical protein
MAMGQTNVHRPRTGQLVRAGLIAGMIAAIVMAMYAMIAGAAYKNSGFFTPTYHIASVFIDPKTMETSMKEAMEGNLFYFRGGPAVLGLIIHMMVGAFWGLVFAAVARSTRLTGFGALLGGVVYGFAVLAFMSFVTLPFVADLFGAGEPISEMPEMAGWETFAVEHALYGLVLGLWPVVKPETVAGSPARAFDREPLRT